jgi:ribose transport system permease protein
MSKMVTGNLISDPPQPAGRKRSMLKNMLQARETGVLAALCFMSILMSLVSPYFFKTENIFNLLRGMSTIGIMSIGMTMIIITGGIDLSVGSLLGVTGMLTARLMYQGISPAIALIGGLGIGCLLGLINGMIITKVKVTPFIATLGMLSIGRGLTYLIATGLQGAVASNIPMTNQKINFLGAGYIGPIPFPVIEMTILVILFSLFLKYSVLGRQIYAVGSNEEAARLSGVNTEKIKLFVYTLTGALCALSGIMCAGLLSTAATNAGQGNELDVIAAVVIGGASLNGGVGTIIGAIIGAAIMGVLRNSFILLHLPAYMQTVAIGVVIILAVSTDRLRKRSNS